MHGMECGIETSVNQDDRYEYGGLSPSAAQGNYVPEGKTARSSIAQFRSSKMNLWLDYMYPNGSLF